MKVVANTRLQRTIAAGILDVLSVCSWMAALAAEAPCYTNE
jgi:hypothetical protein